MGKSITGFALFGFMIYVISKDWLQVVVLARNHKFNFGYRLSLYGNCKCRHGTLYLPDNPTTPTY